MVTGDVFLGNDLNDLPKGRIEFFHLRLVKVVPEGNQLFYSRARRKLIWRRPSTQFRSPLLLVPPPDLARYIDANVAAPLAKELEEPRANYTSPDGDVIE